MSTSITTRQPEKVIYQGDDADRLAELTRKLEIAERLHAQAKDAPRRIGDTLPSAKESREELEAFVTEAAERAFVIRFQHIGSKRFRDLVLAHPPRKVDGEPDETGQVRQVDHPADVLGVNMDTLPSALLLYRDDVVRTIVEPDLDEPGLLRLIEVDLSEGDVEDLFGRVWALNTGASTPPKAVEDWLASRTSPVMSESLEPSD